LRKSNKIVLAVDCESDRVVGFITAITDGTLSAYIPFLEVIPSHRHQGLGHELARRMLEKLNGYYMIDLCCDPEMESFYRGFGMTRSMAMSIRNHARQSGASRNK
jgi:ribosomal protein S18 acetylase RimI-like enzyme